jgi:hypothetical protein
MSSVCLKSIEGGATRSAHRDQICEGGPQRREQHGVQLVRPDLRGGCAVSTEREREKERERERERMRERENERKKER